MVSRSFSLRKITSRLVEVVRCVSVKSLRTCN